MPSKTPHSNGKEPVENGIRNTQDVDMKDDSSSLKGKGKKTLKEGDDEMTVVVPPSKASKQSSAPPPSDNDGDVAMEDSDKADDGGEVKVDPVAQTVAGRKPSPFSFSPPPLPLRNPPWLVAGDAPFNEMPSEQQISRAILPC